MLRKRLTTILAACILFYPFFCIADQNDINVGVIIPLSGAWAVWGDGIRKALELYSEEHAGAIRWHFRFEDEGTCDAQKAVSAYRAIRSQDKTGIFVLGCLTGARAIAPIAKSEGTLLLSAGFEQAEIFKVGARLINFAMQVDSEARALAGAIEKQGIKKIGIIRNAGVEDFVSGMQQQWNGRVEIVSDTVLGTDDLDLGASLLKIKSMGVDGLFLNLGEYQLSAALRKYHELGITFPLFTSYGTDSLVRTNPALRAQAEGVQYSHPQVSSNGNALQLRFENRFKTPPNVNSLFVYDGMTLLEGLIPGCSGGADTKCLFEKIADDEPREGNAGKFVIHHDGSISRQFELRSITGGAIQTKIPAL